MKFSNKSTILCLANKSNKTGYVQNSKSLLLPCFYTVKVLNDLLSVFNSLTQSATTISLPSNTFGKKYETICFPPAMGK